MNSLDTIRKIHKYKISKKSVPWKEVVECGRTDRKMDKQDESKGHFSLFC